MRLRIALLAGAALASGVVSARAAVPHTLQEALSASYSNNPTLLQERAHLRSVDENVPVALSGWRPTVIVQGTPGYGYGSSVFPGGLNALTGQAAPNSVIPEDRYEAALQATFSQPIYRGGHTRAQTHGAENQVMAERARLIATEAQVFFDTVSAYVTVIEDEQLLALDVNNEQVLTRQLQQANDRFRVGEITRTDVAQAEAALAQSRTTRQTGQGTLEVARATYLRLVGELPDHLTEPQPLKLPVKNEIAANHLASVNNPSVIAAMYDDAAARDAIDVAYSALLPQLSLQTTGFKDINVIEPGTRQTGGALTLNASIPLYQGGSEYALVRQARQTEQSTRKALDLARRQAKQLATQYWETLVAARASITSAQVAVHANEIALQGVEREALVGSRTTFDVLLQQQTLLQSRTTLVQNLASLIIASYDVAYAVGRLTARDLALPVPLYDETAYYNAVRNRWFGTGDYATSQPGR